MDNEEYQNERKRLAAKTLSSVVLIPLSAMSVHLVSSVNPEEPNDGSYMLVGSLLMLAEVPKFKRLVDLRNKEEELNN